MRSSGTALLLLSACVAPQGSRPAPPNIVLILADDLGYGDLGCYGQKLIATPRLDRMAAEGLRFTQFYAGSTVCAPSRCVLMTGRHTGRARVRGNGAGLLQSLRAEDVTVAEVLKGAGYATALIGKWGLGELEHEGHPRRQGFDFFYGYLNQTHAHNYYPEFLWRNEEKVPLRNEVAPVGNGPGGVALKRVDYSHDLIAGEALRWVRENARGPFFLTLAFTTPHANNEATRTVRNGAEVPDFGAYTFRDWPDPDKGQAAMISRMDRDVGRMLDLLRELRIDGRTLVLFSSDNGPHNEAGHDPSRFRPAGPLRGMKRDLYEGGIRVPAIAWWPGTVMPGGLSGHAAYLGDILATAAELAGLPAPPGTDGISFVPTLRDPGRAQEAHRYLYWEFYERGSAQALRMGKWKAVAKPFGGTIELFDLEADIAESADLSALHPDVVERMRAAMVEAHVPSPLWKLPRK